MRRLSSRYRLCLIGRDQEGRSATLEAAGIRDCFSVVRFVPEKTPEAFSQVVGSGPLPVSVVGDRMREEIRIGNRLGYRSIWVRAGKFASEAPDAETGEPTHIVPSVLAVECLLEREFKQ